MIVTKQSDDCDYDDDDDEEEEEEDCDNEAVDDDDDYYYYYVWFGMMWKGSVGNVQFVHARQWTSASSMSITVVYLDPTCSPLSQNGRIPVVLDRHAPAGQRSFGQFFAIYLQLETLLGA